MKLLRYLSKRSRLFIIVLGLILVVLLGALDYLTGTEFAFSIFYLIPVGLVAWLVNKWAGVLISIASAVSWFIADVLVGQQTFSHPTIPYWNAGLGLGLFLIMTYALSTLRTARVRQEELAHFIVHDLRAPLANVMTGLETLREIEDETGDTTRQRLIELCLMSGQRMLTLINSLLDLSQLESGQLPLSLGQVEVEELVEASLKQVAWWAERNQVKLASNLAANTSVYADPVMTVRILVNLLSNAIKFSRAQTAVTVCAAPFNDNMIAFSVADQGGGIAKEWQNRVFDKFAQVDARKAGKPMGSGLGLTFCRLAVEAQGGHIWVESEIDKGTTVTFTLPASELKPQAVATWR